MMIAEVGPIGKVRGSKMAMVAVGPSPGRTPINVPIMTPMKHAKRLSTVNVVLKPKMRKWIASMFSES